ncbi:MAG: tRNA (adenosine(37)-N6)-dimethylallyltransferase MiaA [Firmicutes bacterium]|nr:tRNA (adenosine(37)-N6)-dimethylallyltransferase MiaA [Bacillota bacterium]
MSIDTAKKTKIIVVGGPTASGKSAFAVEIARVFDGEVIGADSMQVYRRMNIGTGKLSSEEMRGVPHKMIDIVEPVQEYSVGAYVKDAKKEIENCFLRGKLPVVAGGTGLYINALLSGYSFSSVRRDENYRNELKQRVEEFGTQNLYEELRLTDPDSAAKISPTDTKRIIRALEIFKVSGERKSEKTDVGEGEYDYLFFVPDIERAVLYKRIEDRADKMLRDGLIEEVKLLNLPRECQSMQAIGYKETASFLEGEIDLKQLAELIKINTRHYAKRQITYFKNVFPSAVWAGADEFDRVFMTIKEFLAE